MITRWPLRTRMWFFFGFGTMLTLGGLSALLANEGPGVVIVFIVAAGMLIRGFIDFGRLRRERMGPSRTTPPAP